MGKWGSQKGRKMAEDRQDRDSVACARCDPLPLENRAPCEAWEIARGLCVIAFREWETDFDWPCIVFS